ncbi:MAG: MoxR family ATPase, partial [Symploca sp. SIO2E6]|nr:MoxR family ATPase [Symploca sp. SIO2E6]
MTDWKIFKGNSEPHDGIKRLPEPPNWRKFIGANDEIIEEIEQRWPKFGDGLSEETEDWERGKTFRIHTDRDHDKNNVINMVNAALYL